MDFEDILKELISNLDGALGATLMGMDGIPLACYLSPKSDSCAQGETCEIESLGVEYGKILGEISKASEVLNLGDLTDVTLNLEGVVVCLRLVTPEYFLALLVLDTTMIGKARFLMKSAAARACKQIIE
jgi:predicted regulator of Ras-like GTPase activity (Roadblock/LC7/MglB family)